MKAKVLVVVLVWGVFLGVLAWRFGGTEAIESLAADVGCPGGQCFLKGAAAPQPGRANLQWPPRLGEPYPDLTLIDQTGQPVRLSSFKGSVILIEPVGMTCSGCQAFSGAHLVLAGTKELLGDASYNMIPGFHLVDRNFIFQSDSAGHTPRHNLVTHLLPMVPKLLAVPAVAAADRALPRPRTVSDVEAATMSPDERAFLRQMFDVVDLGIVERVDMLTSLKSNRRPAPSAENYERVLTQLNALSVPPRLGSVHRFIADAMKEQRVALEEWRKTVVPADLARQPLVASSSGKLRQAYAELLPLFPQEGDHNKAAFFDYLCAMDFI